MSVEQIYIKGESKLYVAEQDFVGGGINVSQFFADGRKKSIAKIIDDGTNFILLTFSEQERIHIDTLNTKVKTRLKDGSEPPLEVHEQVEIITKHNRKLLIRPLCSEENYGVIVLYSDDDSVLWSIAIFSLESQSDFVLISLPKNS